jgi:hypothetical protein
MFETIALNMETENMEQFSNLQSNFNLFNHGHTVVKALGIYNIYHLKT